MGQAIGEILVLAVGVAISPVPILPVVAILGTPRGRANGLAYLAGWLVGLSLVGAVVLLAAPEPDGGGPPGWLSALKLALGVTLVALAARQWRTRTSGGKPEQPRWLGALEALSAPKALVTGAALAAVNPKNLLLAAAAAASIAGADLPAGREIAAYAAFAAVGSLGVGVPVVLSLALGPRADPILHRLRDRLAANSAVIMAVLFLVIGAKLVGDAIGGFAG